MADSFEQLNNDVFMQLQSVLVQMVEDEISETKPIDVTRMVATKLAFIQIRIAEALGDVTTEDRCPQPQTT